MPRIHLLFMCALLAASAGAETRTLLEHPQRGARPSKLWRLSVAALAAGSATDAWSSFGRYEGNAVLRDSQQQFSGRAIGLKVAIAGGGVAAQWLVLRKRPAVARAAAFTNFSMAGLFTGVAVRNRLLIAAKPNPLR
jgi:hypothetical protein